MENKGSTGMNITNSTPKPKKQFQRRRQNAESLYSIYEENVMGIAAGFFCAFWAGRLMGEPISMTFTTVNYVNTDDVSHYYFGIKDMALVILVSSKLLFIRICILRYILHPLLRIYFSALLFTRRQQFAAIITLVIIRLASICACLLGRYADWSNHPGESVSLYTKLLVIVQGSLQITYLVVHYLEDSRKTWNGCKKAAAALTMCALVYAGYFGKPSFAVTVVIAGDVIFLLAVLLEVGYILTSK